MPPNVHRPDVYNPNTLTFSNESMFCSVDLPLSQVSFCITVSVNSHTYVHAQRDHNKEVFWKDNDLIKEQNLDSLKHMEAPSTKTYGSDSAVTQASWQHSHSIFCIDLQSICEWVTMNKISQAKHDVMIWHMFIDTLIKPHR